MRLVVALGGNALLRREQRPTCAAQRENAVAAAAALAPLLTRHEIVVTHGNGPQVGLLALQAEAYRTVPPYPLDVLDAESEGQIGYLLEQELRNHAPGREFATLLTQVRVDPEDPAFRHPAKPIGPLYDAESASRLDRELGWTMLADGDRFRRAVPSPEPRAILELPSIRHLLACGVVVICVGGGGIPVAAAGERLLGVEAVIDKDLASALLARELGADALLLLTDVPGVMAAWATPDERLIRSGTPAELRQLDLAPGSMAPKIEAACRFVAAGGAFAAIGRLEDAVSLAAQEAGTLVRA